MKRSKQQISRLLLLVVRRIGEIWAWVVILGWLESRATVQRWLLRIFVKTKIKDRSLSKAGNWLEPGSGVVRSRQRLGFYASALRTLLHKILSEPPQSKITAPWKPIDQTQVILRWDKMVYWQNWCVLSLLTMSGFDLQWFSPNLVCIHDHLFTNQASSITPSVWSEGQHILAWDRIGRDSE